MMRSIYIGCLILLFSACSGKKESSRDLEISFGAVVATDLTGGLIVRMENVTSGLYTDVEVTSSPYKVMMTDGKWNIYVVAFKGPAAFSGDTHCGGVQDLDLTSTKLVIDITVAIATCSTAPYSTLIATKNSNWDQALWDQAKWGP